METIDDGVGAAVVNVEGVDLSEAALVGHAPLVGEVSGVVAEPGAEVLTVGMFFLLQPRPRLTGSTMGSVLQV